MANNKVIKVKGVNKNVYETTILPNMDLIKAYIRDGLTVAEVGTRLGITSETINRYRRLHPEFDEMFKSTREQCDLVNVVGSYYRQATGYTVIERSKKYKYVNGEKTLAWETETEKYIPPSEKATANWIALRLKNDPVWGELASLLYKSSDGQKAEEAGVVLMPPKREASEEKIIDIVVKEEVDGEDVVDSSTKTG